MSNYLVEKIDFYKGFIMNKELLKVGNKLLLEYFLNNKKIKVKRNVIIVGEDEDSFYVDTGFLKYTPILKRSIVNASNII